MFGMGGGESYIIPSYRRNYVGFLYFQFLWVMDKIEQKLLSTTLHLSMLYIEICQSVYYLCFNTSAFLVIYPTLYLGVVSPILVLLFISLIHAFSMHTLSVCGPCSATYLHTYTTIIGWHVCNVTINMHTCTLMNTTRELRSHVAKLIEKQSGDNTCSVHTIHCTMYGSVGEVIRDQWFWWQINTQIYLYINIIYAAHHLCVI